MSFKLVVVYVSVLEWLSTCALAYISVSVISVACTYMYLSVPEWLLVCFYTGYSTYMYQPVLY